MSNADSSIELWNRFSRTAGDKAKGDAAAITAIIDYMELRRISPSITFASYLAAKAALLTSDQPDDLSKIVADALPRTKKAAEALNRRQWSAKEVAGFLLLYMDIVQAADAAQEPVIPLSEFLAMPAMQEAYLRGDFDEKPKAEETHADGIPVKSPGARCVHTHEGGRQERGVVTGSDETGVTVKTDAGEILTGLPESSVVRNTDPPPNDPVTPDGKPLPCLARGVLTLPATDYSAAQSRLNSPGPVGSVEFDAVMHTFSFDFEDGHSVIIDVANGEPKPWVDAYLVETARPEVSIADVPPREQLLGTYRFIVEAGWYELEVVKECEDQ